MLDHVSSGPRWLAQPQIAEIVSEALHYRDGKEYELLAYCIMPNHVHMVIELVGRNDIPTYTAKPLFRILQSLKRHTARKCNRALHRQGAFWQDESYDHVIRDEKELEQTIEYVLNNPVNAGLVQSWEQWPWAYVKPGVLM
jgi:putative transposase